MSERVTLYFATRNRPSMLRECLENVAEYCPKSKVLVANCSSENKMQESSAVIQKFPNVVEHQYCPDPGMVDSYNNLYDKIETEFSLVWADDMFFFRGVDELVRRFDDPNVVLIGLPMIDDLLYAPSQDAWPIDQFGCALWIRNGHRCAHNSIVRMSYFAKFEKVFTPDYMIDNFMHDKTAPDQRVWPTDGPYVKHLRVDDETRLNSLLTSDRFRYPVGHRGRGGSTVKTVAEREENLLKKE